AGASLFHLVTAVVVERADLPPSVACDDRIADLERAAMDEHRRNGAAADVKARLDDRPRGFGGRVCRHLEFGVRDEQNLLEQVVEVLGLLGGDVRELRRAAPLFWLEAIARQLGAHTSWVRVR